MRTEKYKSSTNQLFNMSNQIETINGYVIGVGQYLEAIQKTAWTTDLDDRRLSLINNALASMTYCLEIIKGATEDVQRK